jgi:ABC-2 type transport system ATP-binding protein
MDVLISLYNIKKRFGEVTVLKGIDLQIRKGEIFGLLGPNGAGKTTLIRSLLSLIKTDEGLVEFKGSPRTDQDIQECFGFLPENFFPPRNLKARELLEILGWGFGLTSGRVDSLLELVGLRDQGSKYIRAYSRGMIQRLGLAVALLKDPEVLVFDEPTLGLDPLGQRQVLGLLRQLNQKGKTIFFSSHILSQIEKLCSRIGIIHQGSISFVGTVGEVLQKHSTDSLDEAFLRQVSPN